MEKQHNRRQIQKEETRARIVVAALQLYGQKGITATTTAAVAAAAGVSHGTIFSHFPREEDLINTVIDNFGRDAGLTLHQMAEDCAGLQALLAAHIRSLASYEPFYIRLLTERRLLPQSAQTALTGIQSVISFHLAPAAEREMAAGLIVTMPVHLLFNTWIGLLHHYLMNDDLFAPEGGVLHRYGEELLNHFMLLLTKGKPCSKGE